jgi:hypothetical protein
MKTAWLLLFLSAVCFTLAGCATPAETSVAIAAVGASAAALVEVIAPLLSPEDLARMQLTASNIDGTVQATSNAVRTIVDAITAMKGTVGEQFAHHAQTIAKATESIAAMPSREEVYLVNGGSASAALGASRALSAVKHRKRGNA